MLIFAFYVRLWLFSNLHSHFHMQVLFRNVIQPFRLIFKEKNGIFGKVNLCWLINICIIPVSMEKPLEPVSFCMFRTHELGKTNYSPYLNKATLTMLEQINHKGLRSAK